MRHITNLFILFTLFFSISNLYAEKQPYYTKWYKWVHDMINYKKSILVNTNSWVLIAYYYWQAIWQFPASVWNKNWPTPMWRFKIIAKMPIVKSKTNWLLMPYWMEFYWKWKYWIHAMPLYADWKPKYDQSYVYQKLWWWCVRLKDDDIKLLYNWAETWTVVIVI